MKRLGPGIYETTDGKLIVDRENHKAAQEKAKRHQAWVDLVALMRPLGAEYVNGHSEVEGFQGMAARLLVDAADLQRILRAKPERAE